MRTTTGKAVVKSVDVQVPIGRAWAVFTEAMGSWWPLATHSISHEQGGVPDGVVVEGHVGGAIYETIGDDRRTWGTIAEWEPPRRLGVDWAVSPGVTTHWTATFSATPSGTRLELVHDGFEAHGARADELRTSYGSEDGWTYVLSRFAEVAAAGA
jgi:uncharacterized protein YndB with AHSA1/START domain